MNIRTKLSCYFLVGILIAVAMPTVIIVNVFRDASFKEYQTLVESRVSLNNRLLQMFYHDVLEDVNFLASLDSVRNLDENTVNYSRGDRTSITLEELNPNDLLVHTQLKNFIASQTNLQQAYIGTRWKGLIGYKLFSGENFRNYDPTLRPWYKEGLNAHGKSLFGEPYLSTRGTLSLSAVKAIIKNNQPVST